MKKMLLIFLCAALVGSLTACAASSVDSGPAYVDSNSENTSQELIVQTEDEPLSIDYEAAVESLGYLLGGNAWDTPSEIPIESLVSWYAYQVQSENTLTAEDMATKYSIEGKSGLFIPADELEEAVKKQFGLDGEYLHTSVTLYDPQNQRYAVPVLPEPYIKPEIALTSVTMEETKDIVMFDILLNDSPQHRILTIAKKKDSFKLASYSIPGETNETGEAAVPPDLSLSVQ